MILERDICRVLVFSPSSNTVSSVALLRQERYEMHILLLFQLAT